MSSAVIERESRKLRPSHFDAIAAQVLKRYGTPADHQATNVKELWSDGTGDHQVHYYRVNIYVLHGEQGMVPRMRMSDSLFIKCDKSDKLLTEVERKYA
jgi:hypothetical protein